jgi:single-stranded DNA-specific DHH superfamily exonuclease
MKTTILDILNGQAALEKLVGQEVKISAAFRLSKLIKEINEELQLFEEHRQSLVKKYGDEQEDGNVVIPEDKLEEFQTEFNELLTTEVDLKHDPIAVDDLGDVEMTTAELLLIEKFLTE